MFWRDKIRWKNRFLLFRSWEINDLVQNWEFIIVKQPNHFRSPELQIHVILIHVHHEYRFLNLKSNSVTPIRKKFLSQNLINYKYSRLPHIKIKYFKHFYTTENQPFVDIFLHSLVIFSSNLLFFNGTVSRVMWMYKSYWKTINLKRR